MAAEFLVLDLPFKNTDTIDIPQFAAVCYDTTNAFGVVNVGSANAGKVLGLNQSRGVDPTTGANTGGAKAGQSVEVRVLGVSRGVAKASCSIGDTLYGASGGAQAGELSTTVVSGALAGVALEAATAEGDVISVLTAGGGLGA